jgi:hypothetical protein
MGLSFWLAEAEKDVVSDGEEMPTKMFIVRLLNEKDKEVAQFKSDSMQPLKQLANDIVSKTLSNSKARCQTEMPKPWSTADGRTP